MGDYPDWARPQTFQQTLIAAAFIGGLPAPMDVSSYSSLSIFMGTLDLFSPLAVAYQFTTLDASTVDMGLLSANCSFTNASWQLPVVAPQFTMSKVLAGSQIAKVYGSNVIAPGKRMLHDMLPSRGFTATVANGTPANTFTRLAGNPVDGSAAYADLTGFNGPCSFIARVFTTGGSAQWDFLPEILNLDGTITRYVYGSLTAVGTLAFTQAHPRAFVRWNVRNTTILTSAATVELDIIPNALT